MHRVLYSAGALAADNVRGVLSCRVPTSQSAARERVSRADTLNTPSQGRKQ
jgi:hypothetical protein